MGEAIKPTPKPEHTPMTTQTDLITRLATEDAHEAIREGARAPWGDGETLPDVRDLAPRGVKLPEDSAERYAIARAYDKAFRAAIDDATRYATDYKTGEDLGPATERLARESDEAVSATNGVVSAYLDSQGRWAYLPEDRTADYERMGHTVRGVYVLP